MNCRACHAKIPDESNFCPICGKSTRRRPAKAKARGNGQGTIVRLPSGKYKATVTLGYEIIDGSLKRRTRSRTFAKKTDAIAALPTLKQSPQVKQKRLTFSQLYDLWLPTHRAGASTMECYKAAFKYFSPIASLAISDIDVDDLQDCIDNCPHGKRTKENMRALVGLMWKYARPRRLLPDDLIMSEFLTVSGDGATPRASFSRQDLDLLRENVGVVPFADQILCMIYLGFRPAEFRALTIDAYDRMAESIRGGAKTQAGINRTVTISPKIVEYIHGAVKQRESGFLFRDGNGKGWTKDKLENAFYGVLEAVGIDNPWEETSGGKRRHRFSPHSCRHTFATLMKNIQAPEKDKLELIGHTSGEMLRYYQAVRLEDLRKITDIL